MPIKGSFATPSLIAYVLNGKYVNALPLYRMEYDFKCLGAPASRQNMANWAMRAWELWLSRLRARMKALLLEGDIVHADESEVQVLKEPGREAKCKSRMWLFASPACSKPIFIYEYNPTRSGKVAEGFLRGWSGWLCTDGYRPYFTLENGGEVVNVACMVHIRRKFAEIVKSVGGDAKAEAACSVALAARRRIDAMFAADSRFDGMAAAGDFEGRRLGRERDLRPMMEDFFTWAQARRMEASPRMALDNALKYAVGYWPYAMNALGDGRLELDNNLAERAIKPFVIGRKNFLFSDTPRGAEASAGIYSVVATAKANGLNPRKYLEWLLEEMPNAADLGDPAYLDSLMPWSDSVPEEIRLKPEAAAEAAKMADDPIIDIDPSAFSEDGEWETSQSILKMKWGNSERFLSLRGSFDAYEVARAARRSHVHRRQGRRHGRLDRRGVPERKTPALHRALLPQRAGQGSQIEALPGRGHAQGHPRDGVARGLGGQSRVGGRRARVDEAEGGRQGRARGLRRDADVLRDAPRALAAHPHEQRHRAAQQGD